VKTTVGPLLYATTDPEDEYYENGLLNPRGTIRSQSVKLSSVSFENGPIPTVSAYAQFQMTFDRAFTDTAHFYDWMEATGWLDWAVCFGWLFEDRREWGATYDHAGIDSEIPSQRVCILICCAGIL
jgi:hypothetical protein